MWKYSRRQALMAAFAAAATACTQKTLPAAGAISAIRIANASGGLTLTMTALMRQQRFLEAFGLAPEVLTIADGTRILGGVVSGWADTSMMSGFGQVFPAIEHGAPLKILGGGALVPTLALFSARPDIRTLNDLKGKAIGTGSIGALIHQLTVSLLQKYDVNIASIRFVNVGSSADIFRAVVAGTVDAGVAEAALIGNEAPYGLHLIDHGNMSVELPEYTFQGAWASDRKIQRERDNLIRALAAYATLYRFVQDPTNVGPFLQARRSAFPKIHDRDHMALWDYIQTYKPFAVNLTLSAERLQYMQNRNVQFGIQKQVLDFDRVADMSLAQDALKLIGD